MTQQYNAAIAYNVANTTYAGNTPSGPVITPRKGYLEFVGVLNQLAGTSGKGGTNAANVWAGTTNLDTLGALNVKAGNAAAHFRGMDGVCNQLAGTTNLAAVGALNKLAGNTLS